MIQADKPYHFKNFADFFKKYQNADQSKKSHILNEYLKWQSIQGFPAIQDSRNVVFIYYTDKKEVHSCQVGGDWNWRGNEMKRLDETENFFYRSFKFEPTARLDYKFIVNGEWILDPRNPNIMAGGYGSNSELAMPQFVQPKEILFRSNISHGTLEELPDPWKNPKVQVYLPSNYSPTGNYPTVYFTDGTEYLNLASSKNILDNLIADKRLQPVIAVFVDPKRKRSTWYRCNLEYLIYLDGLVRYIDDRYATNRSTNSRLHVGDSLGGLVSTYVALERPKTFKLVGCQSGAFWAGTDYQILEKYQEAPSGLKLKCWFSAGRYEPVIHRDTKKIVSFCKEKGWITKAITQLYQGHSWGMWRFTLADLLEFFFPF
ncbi:MAG: alpha/beta hydrolase-fold protein [Candidatus Hodarchaeota archaeon]